MIQQFNDALECCCVPDSFGDVTVAIYRVQSDSVTNFIVSLGIFDNW